VFNVTYVLLLLFPLFRSESFYGLQINEAHGNLHLIRTLHNDVGTLGEAPASMQAAMGSLNLPSAVWDTLRSLEQLDMYDSTGMPLSSSAPSSSSSSILMQSALGVPEKAQSPQPKKRIPTRKWVTKDGKTTRLSTQNEVVGLPTDIAAKLMQSR